MSKTAVVTARVDAETLAGLDRIAVAQSRSRSWLVAQAIEAYVRHELEMLDFIQEGIDSADRGELTPHEDVMREFRAKYVTRTPATLAAE